MSSIAKRKFSGSTDGRPVLQVATASPGTLVHTALTTVTTAGAFDEVWLWAYNAQAATAVLLTIEFGGTTANDAIKVTLAPQSGNVLVIPGLILQNGSVIRAYASNASSVLLTGFVNQMTP